ncbi:sigma-70 family RNA polymerase sigma factor [Pelagibacterales bacterium SAG-MED24]|nr:sigma-70 family RNA polymerase sigma factor [Pelagibacterales bacterium SAG-MED24]
MGNKTSKSVLEHSKINREIVDCIVKMQSINLFAKDVLSEDQEYSLLKEAKSDDEKISKKATDKLSRYFSKFAFKHAKIKFNSIGKKINFEDLFAEANIGILIAIKNFKIEKWGIQQENGVKLRFSSYAQWWVKNTLNDYCLKNSSSIKFCTTKEDEKVFYNIASTINKLKINKSCCDLDNKEISKVAKKLKVKDYNIKKYINSINISNSEIDIENYFFNNSLIKSNEDQLKIDSIIDAKRLLSNKEYNVFNYYLAGYGLEKIAEKFKSNKESVRQLIISSKTKLNTEKKLI